MNWQEKMRTLFIRNVSEFQFIYTGKIIAILTLAILDFDYILHHTA